MSSSSLYRGCAAAVLALIAGMLGVQASGVAPAAYNLIQDEAVSLARRSTLNFAGAGVVCADGSGKTTCTIAGSSGSGYDTVDDEGTPLTQRAVLNFAGAGVTCADDAGNTRTNCTIPGAAAGVSIASGAVASLPGSGTTAGDLYMPTDSMLMFRWSGSVWGAFFNGANLVTPPVNTGWSWINQGAATITARNDGFLMESPGVSGTQQRWYVTTNAISPATFTYTAGFQMWPITSIGCCWGSGILIRDSALSRATTMFVYRDGNNFNIAVARWTSPTTLSLLPAVSNLGAPPANMFFRVVDTGISYLWQYSYNNVFYNTYYTDDKAFIVTADQVGLVGSTENSAQSTKALFFHFAVQ